MIVVTRDDGVKYWSLAFSRSSVMFCGVDGHVWQASAFWKPSLWRFGTRETVNHDANSVTSGLWLGPVLLAHRRPLLGL